MKLTLKIDNTYSGATITNTETIEAPAPPLDTNDMEEWSDDYLFPYTGTDASRSNDTAVYEVTITRCDEFPSLVGRTFEWIG